MNIPNSTSTSIPVLTKAYSRYSHPKLDNELNKYVTGLTDSPHFPSMAQQVVDYTVTVTNFRELQAKASASRDRDVIIARDNARTRVILATMAISHMVTELANGDLAALTSTNLPIRKTRTPINPEGPGMFSVTASKIAGEVDIKMKRVKGTYIIVARYAMAPVSEQAEWTTLNSTTAKFSIAGLVGGARYFVQLGITVKGNITIWGKVLLSPYAGSSDM